MIFPQEYKHVGMTHISPEESENEPVYFLSQYIIVNKPEGASKKYWLYEVQHEGEGLLRRVTDIMLLAGPENILSYEEHLNIKNRNLLVETAHSLCKGDINTVLFTGIDNHVTFVHDPDISEIIEVEILDVAPPYPSRLCDVIRRLEKSGIFGEFGMRFTENIVDLKQFEGDNTVFPCSASGLSGKCLDNDVITEPGSLLVGCEISQALFESRFPGLEYKFISICPFSSDIVKPTKPFIARCCQAERSGQVTIDDIPGATVHWGASEFQIADAIRVLVQRLKEENR
ncbi:hypothetical protein J2755_000905 [Methanohalophilus levihalophilus]|uniref:DUF7714 family protein n=1 Tax=Methanohalophilus levihalophilus TaxID=1431282 RepID=UPI001AE80ADA|nr:hypothetical protein [Methanohalophilus levihalophilus]MBP2029971.1 hypothetical protein [Methanohalophilus levihalophilus]